MCFVRLGPAVFVLHDLGCVELVWLCAFGLLCLLCVLFCVVWCVMFCCVCGVMFCVVVVCCCYIVFGLVVCLCCVVLCVFVCVVGLYCLFGFVSGIRTLSAVCVSVCCCVCCGVWLCAPVFCVGSFWWCMCCVVVICLLF